MAGARRGAAAQLGPLVDERPAVALDVVGPEIAEVLEAVPPAVQIHHPVGRVDDQLVAAAHPGPLLRVDRLLQRPGRLVVLVRQVCVHHAVGDCFLDEVFSLLEVALHDERRVQVGHHRILQDDVRLLLERLERQVVALLAEMFQAQTHQFHFAQLRTPFD